MAIMLAIYISFYNEKSIRPSNKFANLFKMHSYLHELDFDYCPLASKDRYIFILDQFTQVNKSLLMVYCSQNFKLFGFPIF